jgi:hypothetical protein
MREKWGVIWLLVVFLVQGCTGKDEVSSALAGADEMSDWAPVGDLQRFRSENLYDLVDGQADAFFAYGFEQVAVETFENGSGGTVRVEVWQVETPADAYGLFSTYRAGSPVAVGNGGDADPGRRLDFWKGRYFVRISAIPAADPGTLQAFAAAMAAKLPPGGDRPSLVARLPKAGLQEGSDLFFHQEISVQDRLWLGGQNLLSLGPETDAVLAVYQLGGQAAFLLLVQYPADERAAVALEALQTSGIDSLVTAQAHQDLLAAVFGPIGEAQAGDLLARALDGD